MSGLVSAEWLAARLGDPALRIIDLRLAADGGRAGFTEAHIPGAIFSEYAADGWRQRVGDVPGLLPDPACRAALFAKLGIRPEHHVVLVPVGVSANDFAASARAYWTLRVSGHETVSILDGGTKGWIAAGKPIELGAGRDDAAPPYPVRDSAGIWRDAEAVLSVVRAGGASLVDARSKSYFDGLEKASEAKAAGHIPGAVSRDYADAFSAAIGRLRPKAELEALFARVPAGQPVISYCNTGHTAALNWFALSEVLGRPDVALYDGSMTDWTQDEARPVSRG